MSVDGVVGALTWNKLRQVFVSVVLTLVPDNSFPGTYPGSPLRRGASGNAVREMQYYLYVLSLYYPTIPTISYDGTFGTATYQAVIAFQTLFGLSPAPPPGAPFTPPTSASSRWKGRPGPPTNRVFAPNCGWAAKAPPSFGYSACWSLSRCSTR